MKIAAEEPLAPHSLHLGIMAKYWESGRVKTRLGDSIGMQRSATLHRLFCQHLAQSLISAGARRSFVIAPRENASSFRRALGDAWEIEFQSEGDLGTRMATWFQTRPDGDLSFDSQPDSFDRILIGADCPLIDPSLIEKAHQLLRQNDVVLGPAVDGGYYLIGLRGPWRPEYRMLLTDIPWSSDAVFEVTVQRIQESGLCLGTLETMEDVDTISELDRLRTDLADQQREPRRDASSITRLAASIEQTLRDSQSS